VRIRSVLLRVEGCGRELIAVGLPGAAPFVADIHDEARQTRDQDGHTDDVAVRDGSHEVRHNGGEQIDESPYRDEVPNHEDSIHPLAASRRHIAVIMLLDGRWGQAD
jgi:hypothetical protein